MLTGEETAEDLQALGGDRLRIAADRTNAVEPFGNEVDGLAQHGFDALRGGGGVTCD